MRFSRALPEMKLWLLLLAPILCTTAALPAAAPLTVETDGLTMVPSECWTPARQKMSLAGMLVLYNKIMTFEVAKVAVSSRIEGGKLRIKYGDENGETVARITEIIPYQTNDVRLYHAVLDGKPVLLWEETVENVSGRAGIIEYRGKGIYPVCEGVIRRSDRQH
ncbi:MAG: hypothetical protein QOK17_813 [Sphingomonadales bacterium]|jgi:hypothetical protein|nr:hypothetical protein [Sphingomonadales bacterium]